MHTHGIVRGESPVRRAGPGAGLVQLGWTQFWLLLASLGGMLALVALVFLVAYLAT